MRGQHQLQSAFLHAGGHRYLPGQGAHLQQFLVCGVQILLLLAEERLLVGEELVLRGQLVLLRGELLRLRGQLRALLVELSLLLVERQLRLGEVDRHCLEVALGLVHQAARACLQELPA